MSEDGPEERTEGHSAEVSLEEALTRLAEFLSVQLGAEESSGNPPHLSKVSLGRVLTTSSCLALVVPSFAP